MKSHRNIQYKFFQQVVYRSPIFPINFIGDRSIFTSDIFRDALYIASPDLYKESSKHIYSNVDQMPITIQISLYKYLTRMSSRCTPFGLFAGCGLANFGNKSIIDFNSRVLMTQTRFDMNFIALVAQKLSQDKAIIKKIKYKANNSLYKVGTEHRYIERIYTKNKLKYYLSSVGEDDYINKILNEFDKPKSIDDVLDNLQDKELIRQDFEDFIETLVENQILISELEPTVIGRDALNDIFQIANLSPKDSSVLKILEMAKTSLREIDFTEIGKRKDALENIENIIESLDLDYDKKYLFQTDLYLNVPEATISSLIFEEVKSTLALLNKLSPYKENEILKKFKDDFYLRYENEEIPLVEALDSDIGIGFHNLRQGDGDINPLINRFKFQNFESQGNFLVDPIGELFLRKYYEFIKDKQDEVVLTDEDVSHFSEDWSNLPPTLSSMVEVLRLNEDSNEVLIRMSSANGPSAAKLLSRFCYNQEIETHVRKIIKIEDQIIGDDKIIAEIVHLPESRTGNILYRPQLRRYEIPFLAKESVDKEFTISIRDLMVSAKNGKQLIIRSKTLDKEIIPRLTNAHNYSYNALPLYHFLCAIQCPTGRTSIGFTWGPYLSSKPFLPRIRYKNSIICPALWNISRNDMLKCPKIEEPGFINFFADFKLSKNIPDKVYLVQNDNKLIINFKDELSIKLLFSTIKNKNFQLEEFLFDSQNVLIKDRRGGYTNELIFSFYKDEDFNS
ncbi:MAG: lantibiotic dehydratase family protein [Mucilaginibacter sp.]|uniref:lantibiotic dehydratase family protein n=1 Tax=Mucilaginibacter sp. TaxID=1882438 RepID=UPI003266559A